MARHSQQWYRTWRQSYHCYQNSESRAEDHSYPQKPLSELQHAPLEQGIVAVQLPTGRAVVLSGVCAIAPEKKAIRTRQF